MCLVGGESDSVGIGALWFALVLAVQDKVSSHNYWKPKRTRNLAEPGQAQCRFDWIFLCLVMVGVESDSVGICELCLIKCPNEAACVSHLQWREIQKLKII